MCLADEGPTLAALLGLDLGITDGKSYSYFSGKGVKMFKNLSKKEISWMFYDWANSAYTMVVTSTIMSLYFLSSRRRSFDRKGRGPGGDGKCLLGICQFGGNPCACFAVSDFGDNGGL